jgi:hypothetical protein
MIHYKNRKGRAYSSDLLRVAQKTIDYSKNYFKKHNIDPKDFPMTMAYNDYQGLTYEKKGRRYRAYLDLR